MNRRDFIKNSALLFAGGFVLYIPIVRKAPVELAANGMVLRGTNNGEIYISHDAGSTWQLHTRLGSQCAINNLFLDGSQRIRAQVGFMGRAFDLVLANDNKYWLTV
jgi:hypothetical protein